jgi:hypothetical protein
MLTHQEFDTLSLRQQLAVVWAEGTYLARRYEEQDTVNLYSLGDFFCEVQYNQHAETIAGTHTFSSAKG